MTKSAKKSTPTVKHRQTIRKSAKVEPAPQLPRMLPLVNGRIQAREQKQQPKKHTLTAKYLANTFFNFLTHRNNHVGCYFPQGDEFKYDEKRWIGLTHPLIFYLFSEIDEKEHSRYVPLFSTADRWNTYTRGLGGEHPDFDTIFRHLWDHDLITPPDGETLDMALESAHEEYVLKNPELSQRTLKGKRGAAAVKMIAKHFNEVHSLQHLKTAWCFTVKFGDILRKHNTE